MPSTGGTSFLLVENTEDEEQLKVCQCPQRAGPHFYFKFFNSERSNNYGVNALNGRDLISTDEDEKLKAQVSFCVNALNGRDLISTIVIDRIEDEDEKCVNALNGRDLISTFYIIKLDAEDRIVSMPSTGGTSFLRKRGV